jgi:hypothetical protein
MGRDNIGIRLSVPAARPRPSFAKQRPSITEGAGNAGRAARTHGLACEAKKHTSIVTTGAAGSRHSPRDGFNGFLRDLPGVHDVLVTVIGAMLKHRRQLDASQGAPGPHDFAVRTSRARLAR